MLSEDHLKCIITKNETWIYVMDPNTTDQSSNSCAKGDGRPKRPVPNRSKIKIMLTVFFINRGVVHYKFLCLGQTVNKEYNLSGMRSLREAICLKWPKLTALVHRHFSPKIRLISFRATFSCSANLKGQRRDTILTRSRR